MEKYKICQKVNIIKGKWSGTYGTIKEDWRKIISRKLKQGILSFYPKKQLN